MDFQLRFENVSPDDVALAAWVALITNGWVLYRANLMALSAGLKAAGVDMNLSAEEYGKMAGEAFDAVISYIPETSPFREQVQRYKDEVVLKPGVKPWPPLRLV